MKSRVSRDCFCPFTERTYPKILMLFSADLVPSQIEQVVNRSMSTQKSLRLPFAHKAGEHDLRGELSLYLTAQAVYSVPANIPENQTPL